MNKKAFILHIFIGLLLLLSSSQNLLVLGVKEYYQEKEVVLSGLSAPNILAIDKLGRIYFTESYYAEKDGAYYLEKCVLKRYNPIPKRTIEIIAHDAYIKLLNIDMHGNLYYVKGDLFRPCEIHMLKVGDTESTVLYSTEEKQYICDMAVDKLGNIYFSVGQYDEEGAPLIPGKTKLLVLPLGHDTVEVLADLECDTPIRNIKPEILNVYFTVEQSDGTRIYRYERKTGRLNVILERPRKNEGSIGYATLSKSGKIYYLYRQRSPFGVSDDCWSYLEIGQIRRNGFFEELYSNQFEDRGIGVWFYERTFFAVLENKRGPHIFFSIGYWSKKNEETDMYVNLMWLDSRTGKMSTLVKTKGPEEMPPYWEFLSFVIDARGNLYYSMTVSGEIVRIDR